MLLDQCEDSRGNLVVGNGNNVVNVLLAKLESVLSRLFYLDAVGDGRNRIEALDLIVFERIYHRRCTSCLNAVDLNVRIERFQREGNARDKSAAADGNDYCVEVGKLFEQLKADSSLTCDNVFVVEGMYKCVIIFLFKLERFVVSVVINARNKADLSAIASGRLDLRDRRAVGQANYGFYAILFSGKRNALSMVASGTGDNSPCFLLICKLGNFEIRTSHFKRTCYLQIFRFEVNVSVGIDLFCFDALSRREHLFQNVRSLVDFIQSQHKLPPLPFHTK